MVVSSVFMHGRSRMAFGRGLRLMPWASMGSERLASLDSTIGFRFRYDFRFRDIICTVMDLVCFPATKKYMYFRPVFTEIQSHVRVCITVVSPVYRYNTTTAMPPLK